MIPDVSFMFETGVKRFNNIEDLRMYLRKLLTSYEKSKDAMDFVTAELLRDGKMPDSPQSRGWFRVDDLLVNKSDQTRAGVDILFQILRDSAPRMRFVEASLKSIEKFSGFKIPEDAAVLLYLKDGVPIRMVVGGDINEAESAPEQTMKEVTG